MFEQLDSFIEDNSDEILIIGGWNDSKISQLEKELNLSFREEIKEFIRKYGLLMGYGVEIAMCGKILIVMKALHINYCYIHSRQDCCIYSTCTSYQHSKQIW